MLLTLTPPPHSFAFCKEISSHCGNPDYIKQIMNVFIPAIVRIFSFGERCNVLFNSAIALLNRTFYLSAHENVLTIALINIYYLYNKTSLDIILPSSEYRSIYVLLDFEHWYNYLLVDSLCIFKFTAFSCKLIHSFKNWPSPPPPRPNQC